MTYYDLCSARGSIRGTNYFLNERVVEDINIKQYLTLKYVGSLFIGSSDEQRLWECSTCHYCIATARTDSTHILDYAIHNHTKYMCDRLQSGQITLG